MTEDDTFLKLKQLSLSELESRWDADPDLRQQWWNISDKGFSAYLEYHGWKFKDYRNWKLGVDE